MCVIVVNLFISEAGMNIETMTINKNVESGTKTESEGRVEFHDQVSATYELTCGAAESPYIIPSSMDHQ
jgi:hypothetical protein